MDKTNCCVDGCMNPYETGKQPCDKFTPDNDYRLLAHTHECLRCGGEKVFCTNCAFDHHKHGYQTCEKKEAK